MILKAISDTLKPCEQICGKTITGFGWDWPRNSAAATKVVGRHGGRHDRNITTATVGKIARP